MLGFAFVGIAVGFSAAVASRGRAMAGVVSTYLVFLGFWDVLVGGIYRIVTGSFPAAPSAPSRLSSRGRWRSSDSIRWKRTVWSPRG
ncbi:hypothetical protein ACFQH2_03150 [Natronoarchaeum sp. GCM10025703]|uniref:hypothetical protein n=1 Tax=Natronoarchaeum sp. GCM10025703 TaxID=3252685 RepID=UPI003619A758